MSFVKILLSVPDSATTMKAILNINTSANQVSGIQVVNLLADMFEGAQLAFAKISTGAIQATGSFAFSSIANNDTLTVNGRVYTAKTSGASGLQQFNIGGSDGAACTNFCAAVNADTSTLVKGVVTASASSTTATITAVQPGLSGNAIVLANSAHAAATQPTGGSDGSQVAINYGAAS